MYYDQPVMIVEGKMQYVWDDTGKRYLDAFAGIASISVGHCHPHVVAAVQDQAGRIQHTSVICLHPTIARFAEKLAGRFPDDSGLQVSYFTNSGSESNDLAVMRCRLYTGRFDMIALRNGYHGGSQATMALTAQSTWKFPVPHSFGAHFAIPGYCYRCPLGLGYPSCGVKCARDVAERARDRGLLLGTAGIFGNTIRLTPPMCITRSDADFIVDCLDDVLAEVELKLR